MSLIGPRPLCMTYLTRYSPVKAARQVLDLQVGVVRFPGGKWKVVTDTRRPA